MVACAAALEAQTSAAATASAPLARRAVRIVTVFYSCGWRSSVIARALHQTRAGTVVVCAWIAAGGAPVPRRMMCPGPPPLHGSARHRLERAWLRGGPFVEMDDEPDEHDERRDVVQHVADADERPPERFREPHRNAGDENPDRADGDRPEVQLLPGVEEVHVLRLYRFGVRHELLHAPRPAAVVASPRHRHEPVEELEREEQHEAEAEPRM